jgi:hypothetical protein
LVDQNEYLAKTTAAGGAFPLKVRFVDDTLIAVNVEVVNGEVIITAEAGE